MQYADLRGRVLEANLALGRAGLVVLTFGNASAVDRAAGVAAIKPSGVPYERLSPADIAVVDLATGAVVDGDTRRVPSVVIAGGAWTRRFGQQLEAQLPVGPYCSRFPAGR